MVSTTLRSPYRHLDPELQQEVRTGTISPLKAVSIQIKKLKKTGQAVPEALHYARRASEHRMHESRVDSGDLESFKREVPRDHSLRIFESKFETVRSRLYGKNSRGFVSRLARDVKSDSEFMLRREQNKKKEKQSYLAQFLRRAPFLNSLFQSDADNSDSSQEIISAKDFFSWLLKNDVMSQSVVNKLVELSKGRGNQGPGLGPMNERRAGLALAILKDADLINDFQICGEAGKPLQINKTKGFSIDYSRHEEAMAIDVLVMLKAKGVYEYLPIQIKSSGSEGFDVCERYLTFNAREKYILEKTIPNTKGLFVENPDREGNFRLKFRRKVFKISLNQRKLIKKHTRDYEQDIVNKLMAAIESLQAEGATLKLKSAYKTPEPMTGTRLSLVQKMLKLFIHDSQR